MQKLQNQLAQIWFWAILDLAFSDLPLGTSRPEQLREAVVPKAVFSDLDGTLLHYPKHFTLHGVTITKEDPVAQVGIVRNKDGEERICRLFRSSALGNGFMSYR